MKIIQIIPSLGVGGAENVCETLTKELERMGHSVLVVSLYSEKTILTERMLKSGCKLVFLEKKKGTDLNCVRKLRRLIISEKPDVIHTHLYALKYAALAAIGTKLPIIHTVHNIASKEASKIDQLINRLIYSMRIAKPVALSNEIQKTIVEMYKLDHKLVPVIKNGVDMSKCIIKKNYEKNEPFRVVHIGRFFEQKNHSLMINAMNTLARTNNIHLDFYGDGPLMEACISSVKEQCLEQFISFRGVSSDVFPILTNADVFILPSKWEGVPISIIEAMGTGLPIIATKVGGITDMLENEKSALLIDPIEEDLINALVRLINEIDLRRKLGENAIVASEQFSATKMVKEYLMVYGGNKY